MKGKRYLITKKKYHELLQKYNGLAITRNQYALTNQEELEFHQVRSVRIRKLEWWLKGLLERIIDEKRNIPINRLTIKRLENLYDITDKMLSRIVLFEEINLDNWEKTWCGGITLFGFIRFKTRG